MSRRAAPKAPKIPPKTAAELNPDYLILQTAPKLLILIAEGVSLNTASKHCRIDPTATLLWYNKGKNEESGVCRDFYLDCEQAKANNVATAIALINKHSNKKFQAAKYRLEKAAPDWRPESTGGAEATIAKLKEKLPVEIFAQVEEALDDGPQVPTYADPVDFARERLGTRLWGKQAEIARSLMTSKRVAARSGHKIGKSTDAAAIALWWVDDKKARPGARVVLNAPTENQIKQIIWKEITRLYRRAEGRGQPIGGKLHIDPGTGLCFPDGRQIIGFTSKNQDASSGFSGQHILYIVDEAPGVDQQFFDVIEGNRAGGGSLLLLGNPTRTSGEFFDAFHSKSKLYTLHHISSRETPNACGNEEPIPGLATIDYCNGKLEEWGENDPRYQVRVLGNFPGQNSNAVIPADLVRAAMLRWPRAASTGPLSFGLDPARFGDDDPILLARRNAKVLKAIRLTRATGPDMAADVRRKMLDLAAEEGLEGELLRVCVDVIGIGAGVYDCLKLYEATENFNVVAVNFALASRKKDDFINLRDELYFKIADWLRDEGALPPDQKLERELIAPEYSFARTGGAAKVEPKEEIKKRLGNSPDRADALALSLYRGNEIRYSGGTAKVTRS